MTSIIIIPIPFWCYSVTCIYLYLYQSYRIICKGNFLLEIWPPVVSSFLFSLTCLDRRFPWFDIRAKKIAYRTCFWILLFCVDHLVSGFFFTIPNSFFLGFMLITPSQIFCRSLLGFRDFSRPLSFFLFTDTHIFILSYSSVQRVIGMVSK